MDVFAVTVKAQIYLLAENEIEAENLAASMTETASDEMPGNVILDCYAYRTPNQSDELKARALNIAPIDAVLSGCPPTDAVDRTK